MSGGTHTVKSGDTLGAIAAANGTTVAELIRLNPQIKDANLIYPGQAITLPGSSAPSGNFQFASDQVPEEGAPAGFSFASDATSLDLETLGGLVSSSFAHTTPSMICEECRQAADALKENTVTLGIHVQYPERLFDTPTDTGHAWISVEDGGEVTYFGLYPDGEWFWEDEESDINPTSQPQGEAMVSEYFSINDEQKKILDEMLEEEPDWRFGYNCTTWATDVVKRVTGEKLFDGFVFETPWQLGRTLNQRNESVDGGSW